MARSPDITEPIDRDPSDTEVIVNASEASTAAAGAPIVNYYIGALPSNSSSWDKIILGVIAVLAFFIFVLSTVYIQWGNSEKIEGITKSLIIQGDSLSVILKNQRQINMKYKEFRSLLENDRKEIKILKQEHKK